MGKKQILLNIIEDFENKLFSYIKKEYSLTVEANHNTLPYVQQRFVSSSSVIFKNNQSLDDNILFISINPSSSKLTLTEKLTILKAFSLDSYRENKLTVLEENNNKLIIKIGRKENDN